MLRAVYEWISDNDATAFILVDAAHEGVSVPTDYVDENNKITLNISMQACESLTIGNSKIEFVTRFSGHSMEISIPIVAVLAMYARENGQGMVFDEPPIKTADGKGVANEPATKNATAEKNKKGSHLTLIK